MKHVNWTNRLLASVLVAGLSGCDIKSLDDGGAPAPIAEPAPFSASIVEGKSVNEFSVKLQFPPGSNYMLVRESEKNPEPEWQTTVAEVFLDQKVEAGHTYIYSIGAITGKKFRKSHEIKITVPLDLYLSGVNQITADDTEKWAHLRNLVFLPGSTLITNGLDILVHAEHLSSQDGSIQTFAENTTAGMGDTGRGGGDLRIEITDADGLLKIFMRGENGGKGLPGVNGADDHPGGIGHPGFPAGDTGTVHLQIPPMVKVQVFHLVGHGGIGGDGGSGYIGRCHTERMIRTSLEYPADVICPVPQPAGARGPSGDDGHIGQTCSEDCQPGVPST